MRFSANSLIICTLLRILLTAKELAERGGFEPLPGIESIQLIDSKWSQKRQNSQIGDACVQFVYKNRGVVSF